MGVNEFRECCPLVVRWAAAYRPEMLRIDYDLKLGSGRRNSENICPPGDVGIHVICGPFAPSERNSGRATGLVIHRQSFRRTTIGDPNRGQKRQIFSEFPGWVLTSRRLRNMG